MSVISIKLDPPVKEPCQGPLHILRMCLTEARPTVQIVFFLRYLCGVALAARGQNLPLVRILFGAAVWECGVVFVYLFNGAMDVAEDQVNKSRRPIAQGLLRPATAHRVAAAFAVAGVVGGFALGRTPGLLVSALVVLGCLYSGPPCYLKRGVATGGITGSLGGILTYFAGCAAVSGVVLTSTAAVFAVCMSVWMGLVGSITKDLSDVAGDAAAGRRTAALICGETKARIAASGAAVAIGVAFLLAAAHLVTALRWPAITLECGALVLAAVSLSAFSTGESSRRRRPYRAFMGTQYAAHLTLLVTLALGG